MSTYAIVETGSKQYRVEPQLVFEVEKIEIPQGAKEITIDRVLLVRDGEKIQIGAPLVSGAKVVCEYLGNLKGPKLISFKFRRRKDSESKKGHRQELSRLKVKAIQF